MTNNSTSATTFKKVLTAILIAGFVAFLASCANVDNDVFAESFEQNVIISVGNQTMTVSQSNSTFDFTVAGNAQDQKDVRVLNSEESVVKGAVVEEESVSVLSTVNINVKGEQSGQNAAFSYTISSITICGAYADGQLNLATNMMRVAEGAQKVDFTLPIAETWNSHSANDDFESASEFSFHMIPQNVDNVQVVIEYQVESNGYVIYRGTQVEELSGRWIQNKTYNYNIVLANGATRINYNPTVE